MANGSKSSDDQPETDPRKLKMTLYEKLRADLEGDPKVAKEVALGRRVGLYRMKGQLGTGNFSKVKLGHHLLTNEKVAIKIIDKSKLDEPSRRLLSREICCMECLDHPNVIRLFEVIETFPTLYIMMECAAEGDLHAKITKDGPFKEEAGRRVFVQVASALNHMHKKGVIHRDLKAENVFFVSETQIKVGDFGFSTQTTGRPLDTFCGSPPYAAPELFCQQSYSGPLVDIWAMGVLLYFMISGNMPFRGDTVSQLKEVILKGEYYQPTNFTPALQDLISGILTGNASERYTMADIGSSAWMNSGTSNSSNGSPSVSGYSGIGTCESTLPASFNNGDGMDAEVLNFLEQIGVPTNDTDKLLGEPRNPIAGTYRILLHRKHTTSVAKQGREQRTEHETVQTNPVSNQQVVQSGTGCCGGCAGGTLFPKGKKTSGTERGSKKECGTGHQKSKLCTIL